MSILSLPTLTRANATQIDFPLVPNTQSFDSPMDKTAQTSELPGARWMFTATWESLSEVDARIMKAWLAKLRGAAGRFYAYDLSHKSPSGAATGAGTVYGAGQSGRSVITAWGGGTVAGWLLPGDYCGINGELKIITDVINKDSSGHATLLFEPPLRSIPANGASVIIAAPKAIFRLSDDHQDKVSFNPERKPTVTISALEVF